MELMEAFIKLNSQTVGKDKLARLVQYASRALWHYLQTHQKSPITVDKLKSLEYTFSTFRKLLRFGKSIEVLYGALRTIHIEDLTVKLSLTMSKIATALFLLTDHILWIGRSGIASVDTSKWSNISNRYWLYSIIMNLVRDFYEIRRLVEVHCISAKIKETLTSKGRFIQLAHLARGVVCEHKDVFWDTIKNACDIWIPLTALGYVHLKPGTIGMLGSISSVAGIVALISPCAKLSPS